MKKRECRPKNILSYQPGTDITGKEIKAWIAYHVSHHTSLSKYAEKLMKYSNIDDDSLYHISKGNDQASARQFQIHHKFIMDA